jgi:hypothetical protein
VFAKVYREYFRLVGSVVRVGGDGHFISGMIVVRWIGFSGAGRGLHEFFCGDVDREPCDCEQDDNNADKPRLQYRLHGSDYRRRVIYFVVLLSDRALKS